MLHLALVVFLAMVLGVMGSQVQKLSDDARVAERQISVQSAKRIAEAVSIYQQSQLAFPTSLSQLSSSTHLEYSAGLSNSGNAYLLSDEFAAGGIKYRRAVIAATPVRGSVTPATYLTVDGCGSGTAQASSSWCPSKTGAAVVLDGREFNARILGEQMARMNDLMDRMMKTVPFPGGTVNGSGETLAVLTGYVGGSAACKASFTQSNIPTVVYNGIPLACGDLFNFWGGDMRLRVNGGNKTLSTATGILDAAGVAITLSVTRS